MQKALKREEIDLVDEKFRYKGVHFVGLKGHEQEF